jgi:hypothetical protein
MDATILLLFDRRGEENDVGGFPHASRAPSGTADGPFLGLYCPRTRKLCGCCRRRDFAGLIDSTPADRGRSWCSR